MNIKEIGGPVKALPFTQRLNSQSLSESGFKIEDIMYFKSFHRGF